MKRFAFFMVLLWSVCALADEPIEGRLRKPTFTPASRNHPPSFEWTYTITTKRERIMEPYCSLTTLWESPKGERVVQQLVAKKLQPAELLASKVKDGRQNAIFRFHRGEKLLDYVLCLWSGNDLLAVVTMKTDKEAEAAKYPAKWMLIREETAGFRTPKAVAEAKQIPQVPKAAADSRPFGTGTGFFITENGYLVTSEHVVRKANLVRLQTRKGLLDAKVVRTDPANDIALLKTDGAFAALPIVPSKTVRMGNSVATVGFPVIGLQGFAPKLAKGEIAGLSGAQDDVRYFQISAPVQPGNSGGPLVDQRGNVVGAVAAKLSIQAALAAGGTLPENVNYATKSSFLLSFLEAVPDVGDKLKDEDRRDRKFEDMVKDVQDTTAIVLVY